MKQIIDNRYEIIKRLGSGGMADVYLARDTHLGRDVAIKILYKRYANDEEFVARFRQEAQSAAGLNHPNIVSIYDRGEAEGSYYIAMEYLEGLSLKDLIAKRGKLKPLEAIGIAGQILQALEFAHEHHVIHRDIKPHNIIINGRGQVKVTDFGIAQAGSTSQMTETGAIIGTAQYLSPEQAGGKAVEQGSDLYSVGVVLYEMLTGRVPFDGENPVAIAIKHLSDKPVPPQALVPEIPDNLNTVVIRALAKKPRDRYASAKEFLNDLERCRQNLPVATDADKTAVIAPAAMATTKPYSFPPYHDRLRSFFGFERLSNTYYSWISPAVKKIFNYLIDSTSIPLSLSLALALITSSAFFIASSAFFTILEYLHVFETPFGLGHLIITVGSRLTLLGALIGASVGYLAGHNLNKGANDREKIISAMVVSHMDAFVGIIIFFFLSSFISFTLDSLSAVYSWTSVFSFTNVLAHSFFLLSVMALYCSTKGFYKANRLKTRENVFATVLKESFSYKFYQQIILPIFGLFSEAIAPVKKILVWSRALLNGAMWAISFFLIYVFTWTGFFRLTNWVGSQIDHRVDANSFFGPFWPLVVALAITGFLTGYLYYKYPREQSRQQTRRSSYHSIITSFIAVTTIIVSQLPAEIYLREKAIKSPFFQQVLSFFIHHTNSIAYIAALLTALYAFGIRWKQIRRASQVIDSSNVQPIRENEIHNEKRLASVK